MKWSVTHRISGLATVVFILQVNTVCGQFHELLQRIPDDANALVVLNVEKIFASQIAVKEGWKQQYEKSFAAAPMLFPPTSQHFVLAAEMDFEFMRPIWEVAVMELSKDPTTKQIAQKVGGSPDRLAGLDAVELPKDAFIVKFAPRTFGVLRPANRQHAARWVRQAKSQQEITISPYLQEQASYTEKVGTEIIMALDLQDVFQPQDIRAAMEQSQVIKEKGIELDELTSVLASIRGVTLGVRVTKRTFGKLKVDFAHDTSVLSGVAKPLFLEILGEAGATIDEFDDWKPEVKGQRISIEGTLTRSGLRRLFSFLELDATSVSTHSHGDEKPTTSAGPSSPDASPDEATMPYTSKQYFGAVTKYLNDLQKRKGAKSIGQYGLWFQNYARKIEKLPILNVDPELVDYGYGVSSSLRDMVSAIQGIGIQSGARTAQVYHEPSGSVSYSRAGPYARYGAYGGYRMYGAASGYATYDMRNVQAEQRAIRSEERAKGALSAREIRKQIDLQTAQMRRKMTERYQMEF